MCAVRKPSKARLRQYRVDPLAKVYLSHSGEGCRHLLGCVPTTSAPFVIRALLLGVVPRALKDEYDVALLCCDEGRVGFFGEAMVSTEDDGESFIIPMWTEEIKLPWEEEQALRKRSSGVKDTYDRLRG